ncbi:uncharacterized protein LOC143605301, partial [Bidens hawaiensis]|uniref:uncharacterized protein LOC143605301 n=1 Tax=Bidens hawaiensis TaxID=980011 RepID=UPI00404AB997
AKPSFFHDKNRANLFAVEVESGKLINTDNGTPHAQVGGPATELPDQISVKHCKVFQVLYVGDHIYGDVLRSKKLLGTIFGWRTMLIVPEIEKESGILSASREARKLVKLMRAEREKIEDEIHHFKWSLEHEEMDAGERKLLTEKLDVLEVQRTRARAAHQESERTYHRKFHPVWGLLMKTGYQNSRFAHQVERFACLYTSDVGNLGLYSPDKYYKPSENFMDHESNALFVKEKVL